MSSSPGSPIPLFKIKYEERGTIKDIKEIIVRIDGLPGCLNGEIVDLGDGVRGIVMGFTATDVLALVLGDPARLRMGRGVKGSGEPFQIPVGHAFLGRMVSAMGEPCDQGRPIEPSAHLPVFRDSPPITARAPLESFLCSGTKVIDMLIPLAKGQRELILGDRITGKTAIALDAVLSQKGRQCICIYCCIGKSISSVGKLMSVLHSNGALEYSVVMIAADNAPVGEQYLAPFAAASMGEFFASKGRDVLIVFDDLTKHAWAYRQLSLLLERPPGREAYPGDIFYVQTQLMERAGRFGDRHGGGSISYLAIAETLQGDLTGYIPSNLASMCDGQIVLSSSIFSEGFRPAIDIGLSLSIVGGKAQPPLLRALTGNMRADFARYEEVQNLRKLSSGLSGEAERVIRHGEAIQTVLQQGQNRPVSLAEEVVLLYALETGVIVGLSPHMRKRFCDDIFAFVLRKNGELALQLERATALTDDQRRVLDELMRKCLSGLGSEMQGAEHA